MGPIFRTAVRPAFRSALIVATLLGVTLPGAACKGSSTSPSATTPAVASPTETLTWSGTLPVGGSKFYSFTVGVNGEVDVTLVSIFGNGVAPGVTLGLGIGTPAGTACGTSKTVNAQAGSTAQATGTFAPGVYCVSLADVGNLSAPATFTITIAHP